MRHGRGGLLATAVAVALLSSATALAQQKLEFNIPEQSAATAIRAWAQQAGLQVFAAEEHLRGIRTKAVQGAYLPIEAAQKLIEDTGLEVVAVAEKTVTIRRPITGGTGESPEGADRPNSSETLEIDEVLVTGSRIKRAGFDTLQAAIVTDNSEVERRAYTNIGEALQATPGFAQSDSSPVGVSQNSHGVGQTFVNFFGLGSQRTLTLVNGRRFVSSNSANGNRSATGPGSQVDLNVIPTGLVERVETIAIGGAPVYGSDAIAGTVNIILKDDFEGLQTSAQYGITEEGDGESKTYRVLMGGNFGEGRGNAVLAVEYNEQDGLLYSDRLRLAQLRPNPLDTGDSDGIPGLRVIDDLRYGVLTEGGLPIDNSIPGLNLPGVTVPGLYPNGNWIFDSAGNPLRFGADGNLVPYRLGQVTESQLGIPVTTSGGDGFGVADHLSLLSPTERILVNGMAHYDLVPGVRLFVEASFAHTEGIEQSEAVVFVAPGVLGGPALNFSVNNPFLTSQARDILIANGKTGFQLNRNLNDLVDRNPGNTEVDLYRIVSGFEGDFTSFGGEAWSWDIAYNYGRSRNTSTLTYVDPTRLLNAIDAVRDPATGQIVCASAAVNPTCAPLNLFGVNNFSDAAADYVSDAGRSLSINTLQVLNANLSGRLPFGISDRIAFNVGVERRRESASFDPDATQEAGFLIRGPGTQSFADVSGDFTTEEAYAEIVTPVISPEQNLPGVKSFSIEGAARHVDHSLADSATTWSAGLRLAPRLPGWGDGLMFRGVYTEAIRAPSVTELFLGTAPIAGTIADICNARNYNEGLNPAVRQANCTAALAAVGAGSPATFDETTDVASPLGTVSGNRNLQNEEAKSWSVGIVYQPTSLPQFRLALDWSDIHLEGGIQQLDIYGIMQACYDSPNFPNEPACANFRRLTAAEAAAQPGPARVAGDIADNYRTGFINTATIDFSGLIMEAAYGFDLFGGEAGSINLGTKLFYTERYDLQSIAGVPVNAQRGEIGAPDYRVNFDVGYSWRHFDFDLQAQWRSTVKVDNEFTIEDTPVLEVPDYALFNSSIGYRLTDSVRLQVSIANLFDKDIPFEARVNRAVGLYDALGRRYFASVRATF
jgi:iron complex outermembrane receptor protein